MNITYYVSKHTLLFILIKYLCMQNATCKEFNVVIIRNLLEMLPVWVKIFTFIHYFLVVYKNKTILKLKLCYYWN